MPFVVTIVAASLISSYMLLDPGAWLADLMELTPMPVDFKIFILVLALGGLACAWVAERRFFLLVARLIGKFHDAIWPHRRKKRKEYKIISHDMQI